MGIIALPAGPAWAGTAWVGTVRQPVWTGAGRGI